jgi:hypothetical protein
MHQESAGFLPAINQYLAGASGLRVYEYDTCAVHFQKEINIYLFSSHFRKA